ncbi:dihydroneopterin aldolase [Paracoccus benzoatiresistens]|uniref:dihydroneopterin aldolase n=1 Tax=Paracoccus benzoatiresistens TaxID=2997341 RepID=A0ABT4J4U5_9RHOB|nr:dihydroneopterin aldolase [Paracoccus sp. EF6]MCZ0962152.1 dihydroneopterin aldolase [Paracoccus sp. EF6]
MNQPDRIHLRDHVIEAEIGAFQSERGQTQRLRFNLTVDLRDPVGGTDDHVDRILSYDVLVQAIETALADQRYNLVETLAERIAAEVLADPRAARIEVCVEKLDRVPGALGITISRDAGRMEVVRQHLPARIVVGHPATLPQGAVILLPATPAGPPPQGGNPRRIALLGLDQAAWILAATLGVEVAETRTELDAAIRDERPVVWAPARLAVEAPATPAEAPALAFWLASRLSADRVDFATTATLPTPPDGIAAGSIPGAAG